MAGYIGNIPVPQALRNYDVFTATSGQTVFNVKSYDPSFIDVYQNGVKLIDGDDYTATDGNTVVLASGATLNDIVEVISFTTFYPADVVSASAGGTFFGTVSFDSDVTVSGDLTIPDKIVHTGDTNTAIRFPAADTVTVETAGSEAMRIDSSGNVLCGSDGGGDIGSSTKRFKDLYLSGGVYLGGTTSANLLDDYEEGTWTPSFNIVSAVTYTREGFYRKVGGLVYVHARLFITDASVISGESGALQVEGLPFTNAGTEVIVPVAATRWGTATASNIFGTFGASNSYVDMHYNSWITSNSFSDVNKTTIKTTGTNQNILRFSFSYPVS